MFRAPRLCNLGDSIGLMAGSGKAGEGDGDRLSDVDELIDDRLLWAFNGGFIGSENMVGVPGIDGTGEAMPIEVGLSFCSDCRMPMSGGAGLLDVVRRVGGRSIRETLP